MKPLARSLSPLHPESPYLADRPLRVFIDLDSIQAGSEPARRVCGFCNHELISGFSIADMEGLTAVEVSESSEADIAGVRAGGFRTAIDFASQSVGIAAELHAPDMGIDLAELERQLFTLEVAASLNCDLFVTESPELLGKLPAGLISDSGCVSPAEATAAIGLFLRHRGSFVIDKGATHEESVSPSLFYWGLSRALLPASWAWFGACVANASYSNDDQPLFLAQSAIQRLDRALRARDRLLIQTQLEPSHDSGDEALFQLDVILLMLSGALDATARVAHLVYRLSKGIKSAGWRKREWLERLELENHELAAAMAEGTEDSDLNQVVGLLRNTVHGEALQGLLAHDTARPLVREHLMRIPRREEDRLLAAMGRQSGEASWGVRDLGAGLLALELDTFVERLIPQAAATLNRVMAATDCSRLPHGDAQIDDEPPADDHLFSDWATSSMLALAGLQPPQPEELWVGDSR